MQKGLGRVVKSFAKAFEILTRRGVCYLILCMNLLLVGFESSTAASDCGFWQSVAGIDKEGLGENKVETLQLPSVWDTCFEPLGYVLAQPWDAIVFLAEKSCETIAVERVAINEADVAIKDSIGRRARGKVIDAVGDSGYWTGLPFRELAMNLTTARFPAVASHSAGTGLANYVYYRLMRQLSKVGRSIPAGLIQLPQGKSAFSEEEGKRFVSVLLDTLDPNQIQQDRLGFDLQSMQTRLGLGIRSEATRS